VNTIAIIDFECTGLDPITDRIIELGVVLWSVEHRAILECYSALLPAASNPAARFNGISDELLRSASTSVDLSWQVFLSICERAEAVVAHQADFDRAFLAQAIDYCRSFDTDDSFAEQLIALHDKDWICTIEDFEWPESTPRKNLMAVALAHRVAVTSAHRAIHDCFLLTRLFEHVGDSDARLEAALARSRRPKAEFVSLAPFEDNALVKAAGFHFRGEDKKWRRRMCIEDAEKLPFPVVQT
jgi:DNA polymerase-3 subunit epsilon